MNRGLSQDRAAATSQSLAGERSPTWETEKPTWGRCGSHDLREAQYLTPLDSRLEVLLQQQALEIDYDVASSVARRLKGCQSR
jgi:hypothetical protein